MAYLPPPINGQTTSANSAPVTIASDQLAAGQTVSTAALQTTGNSSLATIATNSGNIPAKGSTTSANSQPVTIATDQGTIPVKLQNNIAATTGTITTSTSTVTTTALSGVGSATVQFAGTFAGVNATFEGSVDNTNWIAIPAIPLGVANPAVVTATGALSALAVYNLSPVLGIQYLRVRATAYTSGTANVTIQPSAQFASYNVNAVVTSAPTTTVTGTVATTQSTSPWITREGAAVSAANATVTPATTSTTLKAANAARKSIVLYNGGTSDCYINYGATSATTLFTFILPSLGTTTIRGEEWSGVISGIWTATGGNAMQITELT